MAVRDIESQKQRNGRAAILHWHRIKRPLAPRCGARRKHDGKPCRHPAMENGRCYSHGGLTPKGDQWHKPQWPKAKSQASEKRLNRKLRDLDRIARARAKRIAAMTPEELAQYDRWCASHKPGSAKARKAAKQRRAMNVDARDLIARLTNEGKADQ